MSEPVPGTNAADPEANPVDSAPVDEHTDVGTIDYYDTHAAAYAGRAPRDEDIDALDRFSARLPAGSLVCDLGCGNGWAASRLLLQDHRVRAIDGSAGLAAEARRRYGLHVEVTSFDRFAAAAEFDGLWACWVLHHTPRATFPALLRKVSGSVRPDGLLHFSVKGGDDEDRDGRGRLYARHGRSELADIVGEAVDGRIIEHDSWRVAGDDGETSLRHRVLVRMNAGAAR